MPSRRPRITGTQLRQIRQLCQQGVSAPLIAGQLGLTSRQVRLALVKSALKPVAAVRPGRRRNEALPLLASPEQEQLVARIATSGLSAEEIAEKLGVDWVPFSRELRGVKVMARLRMKRLGELLDSLPA